MTCGIYLLTIANYLYIGKSVDIEKRLREHRWMFGRGTHDNEALQRVCNKYGVENLKHTILKKCSKDELSSLEIFFIDQFKTERPRDVLNMTAGGDGGRLAGFHHDEETRKRISTTNKIKVALFGNPFAGKKHSEETRRKMSESHMGRPATKGRTGKPHSEETRRKMSEAQKGKAKSEEHRKKLSVAQSLYLASHPNQHSKQDKDD